jgi:hypothetical protein
MAWDTELSDDGHFELPGPEEWWVKEYKEWEYGWGAPKKDDGYRLAYEAVFAEKETPLFQTLIYCNYELKVKG